MEALIALIILAVMIGIACVVGHFIAAWFGILGLMIYIAIVVVLFTSN